MSRELEISKPKIDKFLLIKLFKPFDWTNVMSKACKATDWGLQIIGAEFNFCGNFYHCCTLNLALIGITCKILHIYDPLD